MKYGCIGEHLTHSYSSEIHSLLGYEYILQELSPRELADFIKSSDFWGINVTIPYKEAVIPFLSEVCGVANDIQAVNTVVRRDGKLFGYNTDIYGMDGLLERGGISLTGRRVAVLGTGGTSKTAAALAKSKGADVTFVSRTPKDRQISYSELDGISDEIDIIINTTPCGMYPSEDSCLLDLTRFSSLSGVVDVIYNPLRTDLVRSAEMLGIPAVGGLYMLVSQAAKAAEYFFSDGTYTEKTDVIYSEMLRRKQNIILIGMPSCGKTTVGRKLAYNLGKDFYDSDEIFVERYGSIADFFSVRGEAEFRRIESGILKELSDKRGAVIATGGGAVLNSDNVNSLARNGIVCFLDRPVELLSATKDRPLSKSKADLERLYRDRIVLYRQSADITVCADTTEEDEANRLTHLIYTYNSKR